MLVSILLYSNQSRTLHLQIHVDKNCQRHCTNSYDVGLQDFAYQVHRVSQCDSSGLYEDNRLPQLLQPLFRSDSLTESWKLLTPQPAGRRDLILNSNWQGELFECFCYAFVESSASLHKPKTLYCFPFSRAFDRRDPSSKEEVIGNSNENPF